MWNPATQFLKIWTGFREIVEIVEGDNSIGLDLDGLLWNHKNYGTLELNFWRFGRVFVKSQKLWNATTQYFKIWTSCCEILKIVEPHNSIFGRFGRVFVKWQKLWNATTQFKIWTGFHEIVKIVEPGNSISEYLNRFLWNRRNCGMWNSFF